MIYISAIRSLHLEAAQQIEHRMDLGRLHAAELLGRGIRLACQQLVHVRRD